MSCKCHFPLLLCASLHWYLAWVETDEWWLVCSPTYPGGDWLLMICQGMLSVSLSQQHHAACWGIQSCLQRQNSSFILWVCLCVSRFCCFLKPSLLLLSLPSGCPCLSSGHSLLMSVFSTRLSVCSSTTKGGQKKLKVAQEAVWPHVCPCSSQSEVWVGLSPVGTQWPSDFRFF